MASGSPAARKCRATAVALRAVDKTGRLIDVMLSDRRNTRAAHRFLGKALKTMRGWPPISITTDRLGSYRKAIRRLQRHDRLSRDVTHRTSKYLNDIAEAEHGALKQVIRPARGFQTMKTAYATIKGFEIMRMIRRDCIRREPGAAGEVRFINKLFGHSGIAHADEARPPQVIATQPADFPPGAARARPRARERCIRIAP